jgi:hypothetical protein
VRVKIVPLLVVAAVLALFLPAASADVCIGPCGFNGGTSGGGGAGAGGTSGPFFNISNAVDGGPSQFQAPRGGTTQSGVVTEGDLCEFTVHRTGGYKHAASVHYYTVDGTAASGDYSSIDKGGDTPAANFEPHQQDATIDIATIPQEDDGEGENAGTIETFTVHLTNPQGAKIGDGKGVCKIGENPNDFGGK